MTRYALEREGRGRFCPVVGEVIGFGGAIEAMIYVFDMMPDEAHLWHWVPVQGGDASPSTTGDTRQPART